MSCTPLITPADCGPSPTPPTPVVPVQAPVGPVPGGTPNQVAPYDFHPPVIEHDPRWVGWLDRHNPPTTGNLDMDWLGHVGAIAAGTGSAVLFVGGVGVATVAIARARGWEARTVRNHAIGAAVLPLATMVAGSSPLRLFTDGAVLAAGGDWLAGAMAMSPLGLPASLAAATVFWARREHRVDTVGKKDLAKTERAQRRRLDARFNGARALATRATPLTTVTGAGQLWGRGNRQVVLGRKAVTVAQHRKSVVGELTATGDTLFGVPYSAVRHHMGVLGAPGYGKTTGMRRLAIGAHVAGHERYLKAAGMRPATRRASGVTPKKPMGIFMSCKGGVEDLSMWADLKEELLASGVHPSKMAMFPAEKLNLWAGLEVKALCSVIEHLAPTADASDAAQAFYEQMRVSLVWLVICAPDPANGLDVGQNPPKDSTEFMDRFNGQWLWWAWGGAFNGKGEMVTPAPDHPHRNALQAIEASLNGKQPVLPAEVARFDNLFRDLDGAFDGGHDLLDKDFWFITVPGTARQDTAAAQASAVIKLVEQKAATKHGREITFTIDEFSRVSMNGAAVTDACEALRSQGVGCVIGAHSFESLAPDDRGAKRLMKAWAGGLLCFRSEGPDDIVTHFGSRRALEPSRHTLKSHNGDEGQVRMQDALLIDPNLLRRIDPGDCVYVNKGVATWARISPLDPKTIRLLPSEPHLARQSRRAGRWRRAGTALVAGKGAPA